MDGSGSIKKEVVMEVNFKFNIDDIVTTPLGSTGIIDALMIDNGKIKQCYVKFESGQGCYYREDQLTAKA
jgi:hypothetical protein